TGVETLSSIHRNLGAQGIRLTLCAVKKQVREVLERSGLYEQFGEDAFFRTDQDAIELLANGQGTGRSVA
ncbi:MAG: sodium-independent anion transporter, partial [Bryobacterales bacterium]|nr:sodium-independent anion transporter [Bryobacterales bacterium]